MGRRLRFIPPGGYLVEVTNRTIQGRFLLRPSQELNELLIGVLGRAQRLYGVKLHAFVVLSNHYHLLMTVDSALQMAQFIAYFQGNLAKEAGRLYNWRGPFWHRRYQHILVSEEEGAQVARLRYILANSCKEGLVPTPLDWPGVSSVRNLLLGEEIRGVWVDRTKERFAGANVDNNTTRFRQLETVSVSSLPCWEHLDIGVQRMRIQDLVDQICVETEARHRVNGTRPVGITRLLHLDPHAKPHRSECSPAPLFHCASKQVRDALHAAYGLFCSAFRQSADRMRAGKSPVAFPEGAFPPALPFQHPNHAPG